MEFLEKINSDSTSFIHLPRRSTLWLKGSRVALILPLRRHVSLFEAGASLAAPQADRWVISPSASTGITVAEMSSYLCFFLPSWELLLVET